MCNFQGSVAELHPGFLDLTGIQRLCENVVCVGDGQDLSTESVRNRGKKKTVVSRYYHRTAASCGV